MKGGRNLPSACGPHCKTRTRSRFGGVIQTQQLKHCKRKCCHGRPIGREPKK